MSRRSGAALLCVAVTAVSALTAGVAGSLVSAPAVRAADESTVAIFLDRVTPVVPELDDTLRISGRIVNVGGETLQDVRVRLRTSSLPIANRSEIAEIAGVTPSSTSTESPAPEPTSSQSADPDRVAIDASSVDIDGPLPPGSQGEFRISIPMRNLPLPQAGTYVLGVEALGQVEDVDSFAQRQGIVRTFLPWFPYSATVTPIDLVWLWPVADWPARSAGGVLLDDRTPRELSPGGRLDRIVDIGAAAPRTVSWVADPALLQTARVMTEGYQVVSGASVVIGDRGDDAAAWLDALKSGSAGSDLRVLPYADNDAAAVRRAEMPTDVVRAITMAEPYAVAALDSAVTSTVYWAPFGRLDRRTSDLLASSGIRTVVLSSSALPLVDPAVPTSSGLTTISTSTGSLQAVVVDDGLSTALALPQTTRSEALLARQRFLAETALIAVGLPDDAPSRTVVAAPADIRWNPSPVLMNALLRATASAPWLSRHSLTELLDEGPSATARERGGYGDRARESELTEEYMDSVRRVQDQLATFTAVLENPAPLTEQYANALLRAESAAWRSEPATGELLVDSVRIGLRNQIAKVRVLSEGTITLSGDSGLVPVTIANDLDRAVTVGVQLRSSPDLRLESAPLTGIRIEPGRLASVELQARVIGGRELAVRVQLLTPEGESFGEPARITIASTAYARAAAWVVGIAFAAIVVFVVVGVTRRIHAAQKRTSAPDSDTV